MKLPPITTPDGRRAWSLVALWGAAIVFTAFAAVTLYLTRNDAGKVFWQGMAAHVQVFAAISAMAALLVKRSYRVGKDGLEIDDKGDAE